MTDSPMQSGNPWARFRKRLDDLEAIVKRNNAAPIRNASIDGPVVVSHRGAISSPTATGGSTTLSPEGAVSTAEDGSAVRLADGVAEVQAGPGEKWVPLEQIILDQVPSTDGLPPAGAPSIAEVIEGFGVVYLKIVPPVDPVDPLVGFGVYVNGVWARTTFDTIIAVAVDAAGESLSYDQDVTFQVSAFDLDGEGPLSEPVSGRPLRVGSEDIAQEIIDGIDAAGEAADAAQAAADQALADALAAAIAAAGAQATADGAIRTYYQSDEPVDGVAGVSLNVGDLWYDKDNDQANRYNGTQWKMIQDNTIAVALANAAAARAAADEAQSVADAAETPAGAASKATAARVAAEAAAALDATAKADAARTAAENTSKAYADSIEIGAVNLLDGGEQEVTFGGRVYYFNRPAAIADMLGDTVTISWEGRVTIAADVLGPYPLGGGNNIQNTGSYSPWATEWKRFSWTGPIVAQVADGNADIIVWYDPANAGQILHLRRIKIERGDKATGWSPSLADQAAAVAAAGDAAKTYADTQVATKGKIIAQVSAPTGGNANANNLWINITGGANTPNTWNGTTWVPITDKVAADAAAAAYVAQQAATAAQTTATTALTSANGKNKNTFSGVSTPPVTTDRIEGDVHSQVTAGVAVQEWVMTDGAWVVRKIDGLRLTNLDAASITTGFLNVALLIQANAIKAEKVDVASLRTPLANIGVLVTNEVYARDGIHISNGSATIDLTLAQGYKQSLGATPRFWLPMDPTAKAFFGGAATLEQLTVEGNMAIRGTNNEVSRGSTVTLAKGTTPPASAPLYTVDTYRRLPLNNTPPDTISLGANNYGLEYVGNAFVGLRETGFMEYPTWSLWKTTNPGDIFTYTTLETHGSYALASGYTQVGGNHYVAYLPDSGGPYRVRCYNAALAVTADWATTHTSEVTLGTNGTELWATSRKSDGTMRLTQHSGNTGGVLATASTNTTFADGAVGHLTIGNFDYGSKRFLFASGDEIRSFAASGVEQVSEKFTVTNTVGIAWVASHFVGAASPGWFGGSGYFEVSTDTSSRTWVIGQAWYDSNAAGGGKYETKLGPTTTFVQPARTGGFTITMPTAASVVSGDPDSPNSSRLYIGTTSANMKAQDPPFEGGQGARSFTPASVVTIGDAPMTDTPVAPRALFPDGTAAVLRSANDLFRVTGLGAITVPDPIMPTDAVNFRTLNDKVANLTYTPVTTNLAGTVSARYSRLGKTVIVEFVITMTGAGSGGFIMRKPSAGVIANNSLTMLGQAMGVDASTQSYRHFGVMNYSATEVLFFSTLTAQTVTGAIPWTWAASDTIGGTFTYVEA